MTADNNIVYEMAEKIKTKKILDRGNALVISAILLCFMFTLLLTGLLNGGGFLTALSWGDENITFYAISGGCYESIQLAREDASIVRDRGGAGFVLSKEGYYHILLNAYRSKEDAETVLKKQSADAYIVEINIPRYDYSWCKKNQRNGVESALSALNSVFDELYSLANSIDEGELNSLDIATKVTLILNKLEVSKKEFSKSVISESEQKTKLESAITSVSAILQGLSLTTSSGAQLLSTIRYHSISVITIIAGL